METNPKHEERGLQTVQTLIARCLLRCCCACIERARGKTRTRHGRRKAITTRAQEPRAKDEFRECAACKPKGCCEIDRDVLKSSTPREGTNGGRKGQGRVNGQKGKEDERLREIWCLLWLCFVQGEHIVLTVQIVCDEEWGKGCDENWNFYTYKQLSFILQE